MEKNYRTLAGRAKVYDDDRIEFTPYDRTGKTRMVDLVESGSSRAYTTDGTAQSSQVFHINIPRGRPDVAYEARHELEALLKKVCPDAPPPPAPKGKLLEQKEDYSVHLNMTRGQLDMRLTIDLKKDVDYITRFYELQKDLSLCLHYNKDLIRKQCRALAKCSTRP